MAVVNNQVILDEDYDENYEPTEQGKEDCICKVDSIVFQIYSIN